MSEYERYVGKLKPIKTKPNETLEQLCRRVLMERYFIYEVDDCYDTCEEYLLDFYYGSYVVFDGVLYEIEDDRCRANMNRFNATKNEDGTIDFDIMYHDCVVSYNEALEMALENIK